MISTEIIKNWGGEEWGAENNFGGAFAPLASPLEPPLPFILQLANQNVLIILQAHCEMIKEAGANQGGWTLVARVDGQTNDFAGISPTWTNTDLINEDEGTDLTKTSSMKNYGWGNIISNQLMTCFSGPHHHCATFTHNRDDAC